mmetsp:Transcript_3611/g.5223  ORF Transcript_3611/g.5223 Transcript_3611/m.5223 type:complete len:97 (-) Transcript_3611:334-624(-)
MFQNEERLALAASADASSSSSSSASASAFFLSSTVASDLAYFLSSSLLLLRLSSFSSSSFGSVSYLRRVTMFEAEIVNHALITYLVRRNDLFTFLI